MELGQCRVSQKGHAEAGRVPRLWGRAHPGRPLPSLRRFSAACSSCFTSVPGVFLLAQLILYHRGYKSPLSLCPSVGAFPPAAPLHSLRRLPRDSAFSEIKSFFGSAATLYKSDIVCMTVRSTQILTNSFLSSGGFSHAWCGAGGGLFSMTASLLLFPLFIGFGVTGVTRR